MKLRWPQPTLKSGINLRGHMNPKIRSRGARFFLVSLALLVFTCGCSCSVKDKLVTQGASQQSKQLPEQPPAKSKASNQESSSAPTGASGSKSAPRIPTKSADDNSVEKSGSLSSLASSFFGSEK